MTISTKALGRNVIGMLRGIFDIPSDFSIRSLTIHAPCDDVATMTIDSYLPIKDVDITTKELSRDTVMKEIKYEVSVRRIES